jgi:hypothetical protein
VIEILAWTCTVLVLLGYSLNSHGRYWAAMISWIVGDIGWIVYDIHIHNVSHMSLSAVIIVINMIGMYRIYKQGKLNVSNYLGK